MIKKFYKFIHSSYVGIAIAVFLLVFIIGKFIEGPSYANCADGTSSSSIGRRGACSHHGGVQYHGTGFYSIVAALIAGFGVYYKLEGLFRNEYGFVVRSNLPKHDLEIQISSLKREKTYSQITEFKEARKYWVCRICKSNISPRQTYGWKYAKRGSFDKEIRFCMPCVHKQNSENAQKELANKQQLQFISDSQSIIKNYYENNSITKLY